MTEFQRKPGETPQEWLDRLLAVDPAGLPPHSRQARALAIGYARYLAQGGGPAPPPAPGGAEGPPEAPEEPGNDNG
jgi:hypothetical protein